MCLQMAGLMGWKVELFLKAYLPREKFKFTVTEYKEFLVKFLPIDFWLDWK